MEFKVDTREDVLKSVVEIATDKSLRHSGYKLATDYANSMAVHAFSDDPGKLLRGYRPLEEEEVHRYRLSIYEPTTFAEFQKALNVTERIFNPGFWSVEWKQDVPEEVRDAFEHNFAGVSVADFCKAVCLPVTVGDPNGLLAMHRQFVDESQPYRLVPRVWGAHRVLAMKAGQYYVVESTEKSIVTEGADQVAKGRVLYAYLPFVTYRIVQVGAVRDEIYQIDEEGTDEHGYDMPAARRWGGRITIEDGVEYYRSFFGAALPFWNKVVREDSDLDAVVVSHMYPERSEYKAKCSHCGGTGLDFPPEDGTDPDRCPRCKGTMYEPSMSPYRVRTIDQEAIGLDGGGGIKPSEVVAYAQKDIATPEFVTKRIRSNIERAQDALCMRSLLGVNLSNSGTAKRYDRQDLNLFLADIAKNQFDHMDWIYRVGAHLLYAPDAANSAVEWIPQVNRPLTFDTLTLDDLLEESKTAKEIGLPVQQIRELDKAIAIKQHGRESETTMRIIAEIELNPYYGRDLDELLALNAIAPGSISPESIYLVANLSRLIDLAVEQIDGFLDMQRNMQRNRLNQIVRAERATTTPQPE